MFRTRDFILLFSTIAFLVMAIGTTLISQSRAPDLINVTFDPPPVAEYTAVVATAETTSRDERIAQMRAKISQESFVSEQLPAAAVNTDLATSSESDDVLVTTGVVRCPNYQPRQGFWDARDLTLSAREGARVVTRGVVAGTAVPTVLVQLPMVMIPTGNPACIASDVIGIANDGSLIRNDEMQLYSIFGATTVVGYALDGFPIYGGGSNLVDACGGRVVAGQYRYELQSGSETLINCFAGAPVTL